MSPSFNGVGNVVYPQNLPSIIASRVLSPQPGDVVLDMCAAPGGKTSHIAMLMNNMVGRVFTIAITTLCFRVQSLLWTKLRAR